MMPCATGSTGTIVFENQPPQLGKTEALFRLDETTEVNGVSIRLAQFRDETGKPSSIELLVKVEDERISDVTVLLGYWETVRIAGRDMRIMRFTDYVSPGFTGVWIGMGAVKVPLDKIALIRVHGQQRIRTAEFWKNEVEVKGK